MSGPKKTLGGASAAGPSIISKGAFKPMGGPEKITLKKRKDDDFITNELAMIQKTGVDDSVPAESPATTNGGTSTAFG